MTLPQGCALARGSCKQYKTLRRWTSWGQTKAKTFCHHKKPNFQIRLHFLHSNEQKAMHWSQNKQRFRLFCTWNFFTAIGLNTALESEMLCSMRNYSFCRSFLLLQVMLFIRMTIECEMFNQLLRRPRMSISILAILFAFPERDRTFTFSICDFMMAVKSEHDTEKHVSVSQDLLRFPHSFPWFPNWANPFPEHCNPDPRAECIYILDVAFLPDTLCLSLETFTNTQGLPEQQSHSFRVVVSAENKKQTKIYNLRVPALYRCIFPMGVIF